MLRMLISEVKRIYLNHPLLMKRSLIIGAVIALYMSGSVRSAGHSGIAGVPLRFLYGFLNPLGFLYLFILVESVLCFVYIAFLFPNTDANGMRINYAEDSDASGSERFMSDAEVEEFYNVVSDINDSKDTIIGVLPDGRIVTLSDKAHIGNRNIGVSGPPGSGKTAGYLFPYILQAMRREESCICIDASSELYTELAALGEKMGYEVRFLNLYSPMHSDGFDFFQLFDFFSAEEANSVGRIIADLIAANCAKDSSYFTDETRDFIQFLFVHVACSEKPENRNIAAAFRLCQKSPSELVSIMSNLPVTNPAKAAASAWSNMDAKAQERSRRGALAWLSGLLDTSLARVTEHNDIDIRKPGFDKCLYFISVSPTVGTYNWIAGLAMGEMLHALFAVATKQPNLALPRYVNIVWDESMNTFFIPEWLKMLNNMRKHHINVVMAYQGLGDVRIRFPKEEADAVLNAMACQITYGTNDVKVTGKYYSELSGTASVMIEGYRESPWIAIPTAITTQENKRPLLTPDEIKNLPPHEVVVFPAKHSCRKFHAYYWKDHPLYPLCEERRHDEYIPTWQRELSKTPTAQKAFADDSDVKSGAETLRNAQKKSSTDKNTNRGNAGAFADKSKPLQNPAIREGEEGKLFFQ